MLLWKNFVTGSKIRNESYRIIIIEEVNQG